MRFALALVAWLALLSAAACIDRPVAEWVKAQAAGTVHSPWHMFFDKRGILMTVLRVPGYFYFTLALAVVIWIVHAWRWRAAALVLLSGMLGGLLYCVVKWLVGRHRPVNGIDPFHFTPLAGGWLGLFMSPPNLSFPSGHATLSFATAAALAALLPRWRWAFLLAASLVAAERVLENAHYLSDVVAGAGFGVLSACLVEHWLKAISPRPRGFDAVLAEENVPG